MIWFTGDTHFGHTAIIKHSDRPYETVEEMDNTMVTNWNETVAPNDEVWHVGDFAYGGYDRVSGYAARLNGRINVLVGNHDKKRLLERVFGEEHVHDVRYLRYNDQRFWLSHYAHRAWPNSHHGSYHLFGHSHGNMPRRGKSMDVGVDTFIGNFRPISIDRVVSELEAGALTVHHTGMEGELG